VGLQDPRCSAWRKRSCASFRCVQPSPGGILLPSPLLAVGLSPFRDILSERDCASVWRIYARLMRWSVRIRRTSMKRLARYSMLIVLMVACWVGTADAQTAAGAAADGWYAELTAAATLGHRSDASAGGELGYTSTDEWQLVFAVGRLGNVATRAFACRPETS